MIKSMLPCLLAAAAALLPIPVLAQASAPPAAQTAWSRFAPQEGRFTVLMPGTPQRSETPVLEGPGSPGRSVIYTSVVPDGVFLAGWADYAPDFKFDNQAELAANRDNFVKGVQGRLLATRAITLGGAPGMEFDVEKPGAWVARARLYIVGGRPYQLIAINPGTAIDAARATRFFDSLRIVPVR